ncbi:MAG: UDP-N-acetylglucosamine 2-epimerase [Candidatus Odinarchaeota archaeon]|nr:UDP-N-acetylglucosamine 2-epimerase [Candidatus Odinarchaeota archaeon]
MKAVNTPSLNLANNIHNITNIYVDFDILNKILTESKENKKWAIMVVIGTKPDFYKQYPLLYWAKKYGVPVTLATTGQHYDDVLGYGLKEFGMVPAIDFQVRGDLLQKATEMLYKVGQLAKWIKRKYPDVTVLPIPHGDTLSAAIVSMAWFLSIRSGIGHNEAGLRSMAPKFWFNKSVYHQLVKNNFNPDDFIKKQWHDDWKIIRNEPYPEQWDTFVSSAGGAYFFAPHEVNKENLLREGYPEDRVIITGNSVVDAMKLVKKPDISIFEQYPVLEEYDNWIRVDIHRRGNLVESRFKAIVEGITKLVKNGQPIVWVELVATREALNFYNLREKILRLSEKYKNFLFTPLWKSYGNVIEFWESGKCIAEFTDSGSIQEELNELNDVLCLTARFNTDRPETIFDAHSNVLVPPVSGDTIFSLINHIMNSDEIQATMKKSKRIYGTNVGEKIITFLMNEMNKDALTFRWVHQRLWDLGNEKSPTFL